MFNSALFEQAGLDGFPETFDDLDQALDTLKAKGVADSPMTMPMSATEGSVTPWYLLTLAMGGQLFDENNQPVFNSRTRPASRPCSGRSTRSTTAGSRPAR